MPTPDDDGRLELSHRAWQHVDEVVWTMGLEITALSLRTIGSRTSRRSSGI